MRRLRILVLVRTGLVPPPTMEGYSDKEIAEWKVEFDVITTLREMGHEVRAIGVFDDLAPIRKEIREWSPHIAFMMLEEFHGLAAYDSAVVTYLELMRMPYTGCNPRGLMLSRDKALSKKILRFHHIPTPRFAVCPRGRSVPKLPRLKFPLIVKSLIAVVAMGAALYWVAGPLETWLTAGGWWKVGMMTLLVFGGAAVYFGLLFLLGVRKGDFHGRQPGE